MKLLIDDVRDLDVDVICRNYASGLLFLEMFLMDVTHLFLDNDLGSKDPNDDGYKIACWIEARHADLGDAALPTRIDVVTSNPAAASKMEQIFSKLYPYQLGRTFSKEKI